jgi:hypothetical protein
MKHPKAPFSVGYDNKMTEEDDRDFRDFMESISVTKEELELALELPRFGGRFGAWVSSSFRSSR